MARIEHRGGKRKASYDRQAPLTQDLPGAPAAVLLYDGPDPAAALTSVLALDLDAKLRIDGAPAGRAAAARDAAVIATAVDRAGGTCIVSAGVTGGHHVWIPLAVPLPLARAAALGHALRRACPTLDPSPLGNASTGCMRPPGSPHTQGGYQALLTPLAAALDALDAPNPPAVLDALWGLVPAVAEAAGDTIAAPRSLAESQRPLPRRWEQLAAAGPAAGEFGGDASRARWHVVLAAVRASWTAEEWVAAISGWPWLAGQLDNPRRLAMTRREFEKAAERWRRDGFVQIPDTSREFFHGGGAWPLNGQSTTPRDQPQPEPIHQALRRVRTWLHAQLRDGGLSPGVHAVARAVLLFAHASEAGRIQVGVRALAIAAAVSRTTAAAALWELAETGMIDRVGRGIGRGADVWQIDLDLGAGLAPASGRIWATRAVFRVVGGHGAAEVYEAMATARAALSSRALAGMLGRSPTTITAHLRELADWGLAAGGGRDGWRVGPADVDELASRLGADQLVAEQVVRFRGERLAWWQWLAAKGLDEGHARRHGLGQVVALHRPTGHRHDAAARGDRAGPADRDAIDLLQSVLGATVIAG